MRVRPLRMRVSSCGVCVFVSVTQICEVLGADGLIYQDVDDLIDVGKELNPNIRNFDASCFDGHYCTGEKTDRHTQWHTRPHTDS